MERNTMGSFIAALRKANGLTQKELAERLNVSDKAVSRWERDESCPDLMLVPLIAETFNITTDELLRGERNKADGEAPKISETPKKRIDIILKNIMLKFNIGTIISLGVSILAFILCCTFYDIISYMLSFKLILLLPIAAAFICQTIFSSLALSAINTDDFEEIDLNGTRKKIKNRTWGIYSFLAASAAIFIAGICRINIYYTLISLAVIALISLIINSVYVLIRGKELSFTDRQKKNAKLKLKLIITFALIAALTAAALYIADIYSSEVFIKSEATIENSAKFAEFFGIPDVAEMPEDELVSAFDSGELFFKHPTNVETYSIERADDGFPFKVYTQKDYEKSREMFDRSIIVFIVLFCVEAVAPFIIYFVKKKKSDR